MNLYLNISTVTSTLSFENIPENMRRRVQLERKKYFIEDTKLYRRSSYGPLLVPQLKERAAVITELHAGHGHFANEATYKRARTWYYWPSMYQDIKEAIKHCLICQVCSRKTEKSNSIWPIHTTHLFERFGLDFVGPLTETLAKNKYILVITEYYTRWPMAVATESANAETTAKVLYREVFCTFGPSNEILTDRGTHFANNLISSLCEIIQVNHKFSTPYHPQTNGLVENLNGTLVDLLRKLTIDYPTRWDEWIATALYNYRTKVHATLGISPYELLFGIQPRNTNAIQFAAQLLGQERLAAIDYKRNQVHSQLTQKQANTWTPELNFKKGDLVLVKRVHKLKIQTLWYENPYMVYYAHENNTYDLIDKDGEFFKSRVNADRLKTYYDNTNMFAHFQKFSN